MLLLSTVHTLLNLVGYEMSAMYRLKTGLFWMGFALMIIHIFNRIRGTDKKGIKKAMISIIVTIGIILSISWVEYLVNAY